MAIVDFLSILVIMMACVPWDCCKERFLCDGDFPYSVDFVVVFFVWVKIFNHKQRGSSGLRNIYFLLLISKAKTGEKNFVL